MATREQINFSVSGETLKTFADLKVAFAVDTNTAVLRRVLALGKICVERRRDDHTITIQGKGDGVTIMLDI